MKLNKGFTLAEVLVTLGIISIVAAITTPMLAYKIDNSRVGPALQKAKTNFEKGVAQMLIDRQVSALTDLNLDDTPDENGDSSMKSFAIDLQRYLKASYVGIYYNNNNVDDRYDIWNRYQKTSALRMQKVAMIGVRNRDTVNNLIYFRLDTEDGMTYWITTGYVHANDNQPLPPNGYENIPNNQLIGDVYVDIDGPQGPNTESKDAFLFLLYNDGTLRPYGSFGAIMTFSPEQYSSADHSQLWSNRNEWAQMCGREGTEPQFPRTCTGSIFDNNLKVIYKR